MWFLDGAKHGVVTFGMTSLFNAPGRSVVFIFMMKCGNRIGEGDWGRLGG